MKKYKFIILTTVFFTLIALPSSAADSPSAEELAKMNAAVAKITALLADAKMAVPLHILANQLKTSSDPEAIKAGAKIEKMADDMSSGGGSGGAFGSHGGGTTKILSGKPSTPKTTLSFDKGGKAIATPALSAPYYISSGSSHTSLGSGGTMLGTGTAKITPATSGIKPVTTKPTGKITTTEVPP